jgi:hypothetical protein
VGWRARGSSTSADLSHHLTRAGDGDPSPSAGARALLAIGAVPWGVTWGFLRVRRNGTVKAGREEVEKTAMDVQADQTGLQPEHATIVFERPDAADQGQTASASGETQYADTDQIPAVPRQSRSRQARSRRPDAGAHALRVAIAIVVVIILLAAAMLGLVKSGVINLSKTTAPSKAPVHTTTTLPANKPLLTQTSTGSGTASYSIPIAVYSITVTTSTERSWVSISPAGKKPAFEGVLNATQSQHQVMLGPSTIEIGAGGTTVTLTAGKHSQILKPPAAPFSYTITPQS